MSQYDAGGMNPYDTQGGQLPKTSLLAVSGFVSSVIFCCPLTSVLGVLLGVGGLVSVSSSNGRRKGTGLAAAAVIISLLSIAGQVIVANKLMPYFETYGRVMFFIAAGPQPMIADLEVGDLESARTHLYPSFSEQLTDEQLQYFADQVAQRYGSVQQWIVPQNPPFNPSAPGEQSFDITGDLIFSNGTYTTTMELKILLSQTAQFEKSGIARIVIEDPDLGDLVLDLDSPSGDGGELPPAEGEGEMDGDEGG